MNDSQQVFFRFELSKYIVAVLLLLFVLDGCTSKSDKTENETSTKFQQYYVHGEKLYAKNCSNCHQLNGTGLGLVYPPLYKSDFMENNFERVICLMRYGIKGDLLVNGKSFNQQMHGIPTLSDLEVAEIATYIYNTWEHKRGLIDVQEVSRINTGCHADQPTQ
jgi:mono/diheme cytochrome c family protein